MGLTTLDSWIEDFDGMPGLVIERYDRSPDAPQGRIHQEDMDQALGASKDEEYQESQESGGKLSLERVAELLWRNGDEESVHRLLRLLTLSQAGGNLDMHSKNISMLHLQDGSTRITSANDVIPQTHLDGNGKMALAINRKFLHAAITVDDLIEEAQFWKLRSPTDRTRRHASRRRRGGCTGLWRSIQSRVGCAGGPRQSQRRVGGRSGSCHGRFR